MGSDWLTLKSDIDCLDETVFTEAIVMTLIRFKALQNNGHRTIHLSCKNK